MLRFFQYKTFLHRALSIGFMGVALAACSSATQKKHPPNLSSTEEAWNEANDPQLFRTHYKKKIAELPTSGGTHKRPWSDSYWPNFQAGLANRWNDPTYPDPFSYSLNDEATVRKMSRDALSQLSPAEKYDIYMGNFDYPLVKTERMRTSSDDPGWFGLCHGWAPAALNFMEPAPTLLKGPSQIEIPFGTSDIKALLTFAQQYGSHTRVLGERCNSDLITDPDKKTDAECRDVNAGSFHIALTNMLGIHKQGFVAEIARGAEVWNQPVYAFKSEILGESQEIPLNAAPDTKKILTVSTQMTYVAEIGAHWDTPAPITDLAYDPVLNLDYTLELDQNDTIIGGEWISDDHPDFLWLQSRPLFNGYLEGIRKIYKASQVTHTPEA